MHVEDAGGFLGYEEADWEGLLSGSRRQEQKAAGPEWYEQALLKGGVTGLTIDGSDNDNGQSNENDKAR